jgi:hypothetical protein
MRFKPFSVPTNDRTLAAPNRSADMSSAAIQRGGGQTHVTMLPVAGLPLSQPVFVDPLRADRPMVLLPVRFTADPCPADSDHEDDATNGQAEPECPRHAVIVVDRGPNCNNLALSDDQRNPRRSWA